jgi:hypothetical protein
MLTFLKVFADSLLGVFATAFLDWMKDRDRVQAHEDLGRKTVEDAQKAEALDAVKTRNKVEDDVGRLSDDAVLERLRRWQKG